MAWDRVAFGDPGHLCLLLWRQQQIGILAGTGGVDQTFGHRLHGLLIATGKEYAPEKRLGVRSGNQSCTLEFGQRIEISGLRNRVGKGDVPALQVSQRFDPAVAAHKDAARIEGRIAINL